MKLHILDCGAMSCDLTWLLLKPGRTIRPRDERDRPVEWYPCTTHAVLIETGEGTLLWDTSCPCGWETRWKSTGLQEFFPYDQVSDEQYLDAQLGRLGADPASLDYVVLSHLHFDHAGNVRMFEGTGARLVCNDKEKEFAFGYAGAFDGAHLKADYEGLDFTTVSGDTEILPGVTLIEAPGHTVGTIPPGTPPWRRSAPWPSVRTPRSSSATTPPSSAPCGPRRTASTSEERPMTFAVPADPESVFTYGAPALKFGPGAAAEIGFDLAQYGVRRVLVVTDARVAATGAPARVAEQLSGYGMEARVYDGVHVEPTDESLEAAVEHARASGPWDAYVAVGGGSSIDTSKAVNLLTTNPGTLLDYVNVPVGAGLAPSRPLKPLVAVPTTTGTGSESTTICVLDVLELKVKTGISHPRLRPVLAVVDPGLTMTQPAGVTAAAGMDILCHALESYQNRR
ncbi:N-acyl homoserine lactonase [Nonomuraea coxensis DSM 45129]|uniref:N-acyl homoserine lactonase n=1 Tax=Nonomuraea coxensis DSM 45129 TaxID=1122611 RepID=A0ABX8U9A6_9ACTN|nr:iron-containing alcohol dehydrogenase [Nonomuraea coxensis]QYC44120.1 N-acyl homoserine lactonase [Nonomuraea coxensis DSM 45129]